MRKANVDLRGRVMLATSARGDGRRPEGTGETNCSEADGEKERAALLSALEEIWEGAVSLLLIAISHYQRHRALGRAIEALRVAGFEVRSRR